MRQHPYEKAMEAAHAMQDDMDRLAASGFFNPSYKPYAKGCWDAAVEEATAEEESAGEDWTRKKRATRRREIYDTKMTEAEVTA
jgi:hypothetical protein